MKLDIKQILKLKRKVGMNKINPLPFPVDFKELSDIFSTKKNVIIQCPHHLWDNGDTLMSFYSAVKEVLDCRKIGLIAGYYDAPGIKNGGYYNALSNATNPLDAWKRVLNWNSGTCHCWQADEWMMYIPGSKDRTFNSLPSISISFIDMLEESEGFKQWQEETKRISKTTFDICNQRERTKVVVLMDMNLKDKYEEFKQKYPRQFMFIDYTPEKELVDEWLYGHLERKFLDPEFDIRMMGLDQKKVLMYAASNYLYKFREYARTMSYVVKEHMPKKALREFL